MNDFWIGTHVEIKRLLLADNPKAREVGDKLNGIICPECDKPEAYAYAEEPNVVMCHRYNQCGAKTLTRDMFPHLFSTFEDRFKPTKENPRATASAFLQSRGLDVTRFDFSQGEVPENGKVYPTVKIEFDGVTFQRLIDYQGSNKTRLTKYKGKYFATELEKKAGEVFVVEGILDALSLQQSGIPAMAILSSAHNPETCFKDEVKYILAFDNDTAGLKAVKKISKYLDESGREYCVCLPPKGKDWNDLLISGALSEDKIKNTLDEGYWYGKLATAETARDYFKIYHESKGYNLIFEFKGQTYNGVFKASTQTKEPEYTAMRLLDCTLEIAYSVEDASIEHESRLSHIVNAKSNREGVNTLRLKGADFSALNDFKSKLLQYRLLFFGTGQELTQLAEYLFKKKPIKVRECQALGYDSISDCFVFSKFLYDKNGKYHTVDKDGYFHQHKLKPFNGQDKSIAKFANIDTGRFITDLHNAYDDKGPLSLGFWVSTAFSHIIFKEYGFFPFLSFYGAPHCGKSDLTTINNRCFFIDSEGLPMSSANTKKGELRTISQKSGMVTAMLEGRKDKDRFDYDSILPLYNRGSLQVRAQTTNDNQVHDLKFLGALAFVQNIEQFISKPAKERVVSIHFSDSELDDTYKAWTHLKTYSPEQLAGVGHYVLSNRCYFEKNINRIIEETSVYLRDNGVTIDRIAKNHAICFAGISLLIESTSSTVNADLLLAFVLQSAISKTEQQEVNYCLQITSWRA